MKRTDPEVRRFITEICPNRRRSEIARMTNERFGTHYTAKSIGSRLKNWGLKTGMPRGLRKGEAYRKFSPEAEAFIKTHYIGVGHIKMAELVNREFGTDFTANQIKAFYARHKLNSGLTGHFTKGHEPFNKGKKWEDYMPEKSRELCRQTTYKPGHMPHNHKEMYHERTNADGYTEVKVREKHPGEYGNRNFVLKHRLIYEQNFGPVPEGHIVSFRDGDKQNFSPDNLIAIPKRLNAVMNHNKLRGTDPETLETSMLTAELVIATRKRKKEGKRKN